MWKQPKILRINFWLYVCFPFSLCDLWCHCCVQHEAPAPAAATGSSCSACRDPFGQSHCSDVAGEGSSSLCFPRTFEATHYLLADSLLNAFKLYLRFLIKTCLHWCFKQFCWRQCPLCVKHRVSSWAALLLYRTFFIFFGSKSESIIPDQEHGDVRQKHFSCLCWEQMVFSASVGMPGTESGLFLSGPWPDFSKLCVHQQRKDLI